MDKKYNGQKLMLTPQGSKKINLDPEISTLVKKIDKEKPQNFISKFLKEGNNVNILKNVDIEDLKKGKYGLDKLKEIAKVLNIKDFSKKQKKVLLEEILEVIEKIQYDSEEDE